MKKLNQAQIVDVCGLRVQALKTHMPPKSEVPINGERHKLADVIGIYQTCLDNRTAVSAKRAELKALLAQSAEAEATRRAADRALKPWVIDNFGANSQQAHDFGFSPAKVAHMDVKTKAAAYDKSLATRVARHTMGKKQKSKIKGVVDATAPAAPAVNPVQTAAPPAASTTTSAPALQQTPVQNGASPPHA